VRAQPLRAAMRFPKEVRTYCPRCRAHTVHQAVLYKAGRRRTLAQGQRRYLRKMRGYGSKRKPEQKEFAKTTERQVVKLKCTACGYVLHRSLGRMKKLEIVERV